MEKIKCHFCNIDHLEIKKEVRDVEIKGKKIFYEAQYYFCPDLNEEFEDETLINFNLNKARDAYRKTMGLLTVKDIIDIREKFKLSQRDLSLILGMGEVTISRIESKIIQDKSTDDSIRRVIQDPLFLLEKLETNKDKLGKKYHIVKSLIKKDDEICVYIKKIFNLYYIDLSKDVSITGNASLNLNKIENVILYFLHTCKNVYKTKLNKLMWYADFKNYQDTLTSITGLSYIHKPFGAVPIGFDEIIKCFPSIKIEEKENEDMGYTYFEIKALKDYDLSIFSSSEISILNIISDKFKNYKSKEISLYMHQEEAYIKTLDNEKISYNFAKTLKKF